MFIKTRFRTNIKMKTKMVAHILRREYPYYSIFVWYGLVCPQRLTFPQIAKGLFLLKCDRFLSQDEDRILCISL